MTIRQINPVALARLIGRAKRAERHALLYFPLTDIQRDLIEQLLARPDMTFKKHREWLRTKLRYGAMSSAQQSDLRRMFQSYYGFDDKQFRDYRSRRKRILNGDINHGRTI